jgi:hypothetical protein
MSSVPMPCLRVPRSAWLALVLGLVACNPLRQPLGTLKPSASGSGGSQGSAGTTGSGAAGTGPVTLTGNQIPSLPPEWNQCDPAAFRCFRDPSVPASPAGLFSGSPDPDPAHKPSVVYPLEGSMHPINLADITFQWRRAQDVAQTVFRIRLQRINDDVFEFFVPCKHVTGGPGAMANECVYRLPPGAWIDLATMASGETVTADVAAADPGRPGTYALSAPMQLSFSPEDVRGGFYYWSNDLQGTERVLFGARETTPFIVPSTPSNPDTCGGCHALSRGGATIGFTQGSANDGVLRVAATASVGQPLFQPSSTHDSGTMALNRDGTRVMVSYAGRLFVRDTATGATLGEVGLRSIPDPLHGFHPDWAPDDKSVALTLSAQGASDWSVGSGAIGVLPIDLSASGNAMFGTVETIVENTAAAFNFYPSFSPDGHWLVFASAPPGMGQTSYKQMNARLRLANRDTHAVYELDNATVEPGRSATWPKFAPFSQEGGLMFVSFNSKIDYGFYSPDGGMLAQMWLTAIDVRRLAGGQDASTPPVWLPFQDVTSFNYLSAWSERVGCRVENGASIGCGDHEVCSQGACAMVVR